MDTPRPAIIPINSARDGSGSPKPYLPHLAIYDHLPRNIDIFSDSNKYQKWARAVLPRIASPKRHRKGFVVLQTSRSEGGTLDTLPVSEDIIRPDIIRFNRQTRKKDPHSFSKNPDNLPLYVLNRKKVRPGLVKGTTVKILSDKLENHYEQSLTGRGTPVTSTRSSPARDRQFSTTPFKEAFHQMVTNDDKRSYSSFQVRSPIKKPSTKKREKTYVRISLPVKNTLPVQNKVPIQKTVSRENKKPASKPSKFGQTDNMVGFNAKGNRLPSSLNPGFALKKEKTFPSFHEMTRIITEDFGPKINTVKT